MGILTGVRILAVEQYGAGPFGTEALADLGAEVIKVENPGDGGDISRQLGPYFSDNIEKSAASLFYQSLNRNKKSICVDLRSDEGRSILHRLVAGADAVAGNLRGDVPAKLGLTYEALGKVNSRIVCGHLSAYGREGARASWPGYDYMMQAEAGYFSINGQPGGTPSRFGLSIIDFMAGYALAIGLLAGIIEARSIGRGRDVDVNLFDVGLANLNYLAAWTLNAGHRPEVQPRSAHPSLAPCQLFPTEDGWIYVMANKEKFWRNLCAKLDSPGLADDSRFNCFANRLTHREELTKILDERFLTRTTSGWIESLTGSVPCAPMLNVSDALSNPYVTERGMTPVLENSADNVRVVGTVFKTIEPPHYLAAPSLGENTDELLSECGYSTSEILALRNRGVVA